MEMETVSVQKVRTVKELYNTTDAIYLPQGMPPMNDAVPIPSIGNGADEAIRDLTVVNEDIVIAGQENGADEAIPMNVELDVVNEDLPIPSPENAADEAVPVNMVSNESSPSQGPMEDTQLNMEKVCGTCGDVGNRKYLAICSKCKDGAQHTYCMREKIEKVPEGFWFCEDCELGEKASEEVKQDAETSMGASKESQSFEEGDCLLKSGPSPLGVEQSNNSLDLNELPPGETDGRACSLPDLNLPHIPYE